MRLICFIDANEIPPDSDPILDLVPILKKHGYELEQNGVSSGPVFVSLTNIRVLTFAMPNRGERPLVPCPSCDEKFADWASFDRHMASEHGIALSPLAPR